jgi:beta-glucanase (GH16 family)
MPAPVCKDSTTNFNNLDSIVSINDYLGNSKDGTWVGQGDIKSYDGSALLTMPKNSGGSLMSSSSYMWYGNVQARLKTSRGQGVITAFILFSDVKDEIDYEWVGANLTTAQTNYYFQGIDNCTFDLPLP